ncbi:MAG: fructosamine kinase family protein, partial [Streptosporangiaceae bacterium]
MDRDIRARLEQELGTGVSAVRSLGGQHGAAHFRLQLSTGPAAFAKVGRHSADEGADSGHWPGSVGQLPPGRGFAAEASGLRWLADAGAAVPAVLAQAGDFLVIDWIETSAPEPRAAVCFGRELAALHAAGAEAFGAPWPGVIAGLPLLNEALPNEAPLNEAPPGGGWAQWYAAARVLPYVRLARDRGALTAAEASLAEA